LSSPIGGLLLPFWLQIQCNQTPTRIVNQVNFYLRFRFDHPLKQFQVAQGHLAQTKRFSELQIGFFL